LFTHSQNFWTAPLPIRKDKHIIKLIAAQKQQNLITNSPWVLPFLLPSSSLQIPIEIAATRQRNTREGCTLEGGRNGGTARVLGGEGCKGLRRKKMGEGRGRRPRERGGEGGGG
jgi:hypothetical protein